MKRDAVQRIMGVSGEFILKYRYFFFILLLVITAVFSLFLSDLELKSDMQTWHDKDDPTYVKYREMKDNFEISPFISVAYSTDDPFSSDELEYLDHLSARISSEVQDVVKVTTLSNYTKTVIIPGSNVTGSIPLIQQNMNQSQMSELEIYISSDPFVEGVLISRDRESLGLSIQMIARDDPGKSQAPDEELISQIRKVLDDESESTGKKFHVGGTLVTHSDVNSMMMKDITTFLPLAVIVNTLILVILFRRFFRVVLPLITVLFALVWTMGLKGAFNSPISPVSTTLFALVVVIGIADSIHFISHYRIELTRTPDRKSALKATYSKAGVGCLFTSLTTSAGFGSLLFSPLLILRNLGMYSAFGIMSAFICTMVLVPTGLLLEGAIEDRLSKNRKASKGKGSERPNKKLLRDRALPRLGRFNLAHPKKILVFFVIFILILSIGIPLIKVEGSLMEYLKEDTRIVKDAEYLDENMNGISDVEVMLYGEEGDFEKADTLNRIAAFQWKIEKQESVVQSYSMVDILSLIIGSFYIETQKSGSIMPLEGNMSYQNSSQEYNSSNRGMPSIPADIDISPLLERITSNSSVGGKNSSVLSPYLTSDGSKVLISFRIRSISGEKRTELLSDIDDYCADNFEDFQVRVTGFEQIIHQTTLDIVTTQVRSLIISFAIILLFMVLLFGIKGGLISLVPNILPIVLLFGFMGYAGFPLNIATATIAAIAIGLVVDDTVHFFFHFKVCLNKYGNRVKAMKEALREVGEALCFTTVTLSLGFMIFIFSRTSVLVDYAILSTLAIVSALFSDLLIGSVVLLKIKVFGK